MFNVIVTLAAAGVGWWVGSRGARRAVDRRIDERLATFELKLVSPVRVPIPKPQPEPPPVVAPTREEEVPAEVLAVISAAICAFLGKPARIRRVRRISGGMNPWAQVGRVSVMASHALNRQH